MFAKIFWGNYANECILADKQLCSTNTTGFGQQSMSISWNTNKIDIIDDVNFIVEFVIDIIYVK